MRRFLVFCLLVLAAILIASVYGVAHDHLTYSISQEYYTKFKFIQFFGPGITPLPDQARVTIVGILATWWMGLFIGLLVGGFGFLHRPAKLMLTRTLKAYGLVILITVVTGLAALAFGWFGASHEVSDYSGWHFPKHLDYPRNYIAVGFMHNGSYLGGLIGILAGIRYQFRSRKRAGDQEAS